MHRVRGLLLGDTAHAHVNAFGPGRNRLACGAVRDMIVVGGGIGGLTAALALKSAGYTVRVLEKGESPWEVGAGIQLWINGMAAARELGVEDVLRRAGATIEWQRLATATGKPLFDVPIGRAAEEHGLPKPIMIARPELIEALHEAVGSGTIEHGTECIGFKGDEAGATATLADGREERARVLVIADGIDSSLRPALTAAKPRYAGYQYLRALVRHDVRELEEGEFAMRLGCGDRIGTAEVGDGRRYAFGVVAAPEGAVSPDGDKAEMKRRFARFEPWVRELIDALPEDAVTRADIRDLSETDRWGEGRVIMIGDAAHATTPNLGRGASEAMEDGVALAGFLVAVDLDDGPAVAAALRAFEKRRRGPTEQVQADSARNGKVMAVRNPLACAVRDRVVRRVAGRMLTRQIDAYAEAAVSGRRGS